MKLLMLWNDLQKKIYDWKSNANLWSEGVEPWCKGYVNWSLSLYSQSCCLSRLRFLIQRDTQCCLLLSLSDVTIPLLQTHKMSWSHGGTSPSVWIQCWNITQLVCRWTEYRRLFFFFVWIDDMWWLMWPCTFLSFFSISSSSGSKARPSQWLSRQSAHSPHSDSEKRPQWSYSGDRISRTQDIRTKQWVSTCRSSDINQWHFYIRIAEYLHKMLINISCHCISQ